MFISGYCYSAKKNDNGGDGDNNGDEQQQCLIEFYYVCNIYTEHIFSFLVVFLFSQHVSE